MRASIAAEAAGIPSVSLVCNGFDRQALATGRGLGFDNLPLAVLPVHVDTQTSDELVASVLGTTLKEAIVGLLEGARVDGEVCAEPTALDIVATGGIDEINRAFVENEWSDGLPIIPPTKERVAAFLEGSGHDPWKVLGLARPSGRDITVWSIAVNAVMTGCRPDHLPVLLALGEIIAGDTYGVEHSGNTTGADALIIIDGPSSAELGFNTEQGALREGAHANTAVGRWLRLYLRNVCGFIASEHDKATFGNTFRVVLAEHEETLDDIGWPRVSEDFGFSADDDVVSVARMNSGTILGSVFGSTPEEMIPYLADGLVRTTGWDLTHVYGIGNGHYRPLLILSPVLARTIARAGWTKADLRQALFEQARIPAWKFEALIGAWSNLTAGRRTLVDFHAEGGVPSVFAESDDPNRLVPIVTEPAKFMIAVAGDPNRTNAYVMSNDGAHGWWTAERVDRAPGTDLNCRVE